MAEIILTIVVEVVKCLAPPAYREICYLRESKYTSNLQNLKAQVEKLKSERASTAHQVDEAKRKGEEIEENVKTWLAGADNVIEEADKFTEDEAAANKRCFKGLCPNLKTRRRLSKEAERQKEAVVKVQEDGGFNSVSYSIIPEDTLLMSNKDYEAFESRTSILNEIIDAIKNPDVISLGIYGMGGIGKTTLAKEVARKAESDKLFDEVVFSEVSESRDVRKIQGEIADKLGLKFDEESESGRARILYDRLKKETRILVILDNIWENLDLKAAGIPHGDDHKGCKILLTARSEDVLSREMDSQKNFPVGVLKEDEAWSLFKKMAGDYVEGNELKVVARDVAKECAGLPVSIVTVARALKRARLFEWKDALEQLRSPSSSNFKDIQPAAFKAIELSYNKLGRDELKKTFLLIGYTAISSIDELLMYGMGLDLFQNVNKMEAARNRVHALVGTLKASCMLLDHANENEGSCSMHDVVRDVAISIASTERNVFTATNEQVDGCRKWSDGSAIEHCTSIILHGIKTNLLPEVLKCPQLELLFIRAGGRESSSLTIPNNFFERMKKVRVVNLTYIILRSLPSSLGLLSNLRTLSLCCCSLPDISAVGDLENLEILCLRGSMIKKLPVEVGELAWLKLLDLRECRKLEVIPPNVLSKLSHLEELYIGPGSFDKWDVEVEGVKNASLEELKHLPNLTSLELDIFDVSTLPRGLFLEKLERYSIRIGGQIWESTNIGCREFRLALKNKICLKDSLIVQLQRIEGLELLKLQEQDVDYFANELVKGGSSHLKRLYMCGSGLSLSSAESQRQEESANDLRSHEIILEDNVQISNTLFIEKVRLPKLEELILNSINVERIWLSQATVMSCGIHNLTRLTLYSCMNLRCLFSSSTVSSFVQLQHIEIVGCPVLEELIVVDNQEERKNNIVMFPQLQYLRMSDLEKFTSFCTGDLDILEFPSLKKFRIFRCPEFMVIYKNTTSFLTGKVALPNLENLWLKSINVERIWQNQVTVMSCGIQNLKRLNLHGCGNLRCLFSSSTVGSFVRLQSIEIKKCPILEELMVMDSQEERKNKIVMFPQLQYLMMFDLEKFTSFCTGDLDILEFPSLKELWISGCPQFMAINKSTTSFLTGKVALPNLENLELESINVERIWQNQVTVMSCGIQNLTHLTLDGCWNLRCLFSSSIVGSFAQLQSIEIRKCPILEELMVMDSQEERKNNIAMFPQLQYLEMSDLEKLTSFCTGDLDILEFPSLKELWIFRCPKFMAINKSNTGFLMGRVFPNLEELKVDATYMVTNKYLFSEDLLCKLKYLCVELVDERTILSLGDFLQKLHTMKVLQIQGYNDRLPKEKVENGMGVIISEANNCYHLEHILIEESSVTNYLVILRVKGCNHLVNLVPSWTFFQNLTNLVVSRCESLAIVLTSSIAKTLVRLRYMEIESCNRITEIVLVDDVVAKDEVIAFKELKELKLLDLKSLTSFCFGNCAFKFLSLERLVVDDCPNMKIFSEGKLSTPKLHEVEGRGEACWAWKDDLNTTIQKLVSLSEIVAGVWSNDSDLQLQATTQFRKLLSMPRSPPTTEKVIQSGAVPRFVEFLMREDNLQLQCEAAWALTNIASGTSENTKVVIDHGAVPIFVRLLESPSDDVREQAVWALGIVAGDSPRCRDLVLGEGALIALLVQLNELARLSMLRTAAWTLSNFCGGKPEPPFDQVRPALPALAQLVHSNDEEVMTDACWALFFLSDGTDDKIQAVIEAGVCPRLVELLGHSSSSMLTPALQTVGNIVSRVVFQTQYIINCGALPYFLDMLVHNQEESIRKEVSWIISNITAGNMEQIQAVVDAGLIGPIVNLLQNAEFDTKKEAAWAISNATSGGTHEQIKHLVREGCVKPLCDLLLCPDLEIITVCLKGLENILKVGEAEKNTDTHTGDLNQYARLVEEAEGLKNIEDLKSYDSNEIHEKAVKILETYWPGRVIGRGRMDDHTEEDDAQSSDN